MLAMMVHKGQPMVTWWDCRKEGKLMVEEIFSGFEYVAIVLL